MRILITGSGGFIGKPLVRKLILLNHDILLLVRDKNSATEFQATTTIIETADQNWKKKIAAYKIDVVIHLAAYIASSADEKDIDPLINSNILFATHLVDAVKNTGLTCFINTGSFAEYAPGGSTLLPAYLYAATKTAFRNILSYFSLPDKFKVVHVIPYSVYGAVSEKKKLFDHLYDAAFSDTAVKLSPGNQVLDFIHITDVVDFYQTLLLQLSQLNKPAIEIHLGTGRGTTPRELAASMENLLQKKLNIEWGGVPYREKDTMHAVAFKNLPHDFFQWEPSIDIETGIQLYISEMQSKASDGF